MTMFKIIILYIAMGTKSYIKVTANGLSVLVQRVPMAKETLRNTIQGIGDLTGGALESGCAVIGTFQGFCSTVLTTI